MKRTLLYLCLLSLKLMGQTLPDKLLGQWYLDRIVKENQVLRPSIVNYWIKFDQNIITFNQAINICMCAPRKFENDSLLLSEASCTAKCCDERVDNFFNNLDYQGKIKFSIDTLIIDNKHGTFYLIKEIKKH